MEMTWTVNGTTIPQGWHYNIGDDGTVNMWQTSNSAFTPDDEPKEPEPTDSDSGDENKPA
jgi:hypothetical protein